MSAIGHVTGHAAPQRTHQSGPPPRPVDKDNDADSDKGTSGIKPSNSGQKTGGSQHKLSIQA